MQTMITIWNMSPPPGAAPVCAQALLINKGFPPISERCRVFGAPPTKVRILARRCAQAPKLAHERGEPPALDGGAQPSHQFQEIIEVVPGVEPGAEDFVYFLEVVQVGPAEAAASVTSARVVERPHVVTISCIPQLDR